MKHTKKEILDALKVIRDECAEAERCSKCPFGMDHTVNGSACRLDESAPSCWDISDEEPEVWRAFK